MSSSDSHQNEHILNIHSQREEVLQAIWAYQAFSSKNLCTTTGDPIEVLFAGWWNQGAGPDFQEARIRIGNTLHQGAVELHMDALNWKHHQHHQDDAYEQVILHVVLRPHSTYQATTSQNRKVPELVLDHYLDASSKPLMEDPQQLLQQYDQLPGKCGLMASQFTDNRLYQFVGRAAEQRIQHKAHQLMNEWEHQKPEELLFQLIFKSLGYSNHHLSFEQLAKQFPLHSLYSSLQQPQRSARAAILGRWFGALGLFESDWTQNAVITDPTLRKEFYQWQQVWEDLPAHPTLKIPSKKSHRPQNSIERRLLGMFHHLEHVAHQGLLKSWLSLLQQLERISKNKELKKTCLAESQNVWKTPEWEVWQQYFHTHGKAGKPMQLIGKDRQIIVWANAVLPFFLAYAQKHESKELERLLYRLFLVLPPEASNEKTRFMEKRLWIQKNQSFQPKSLRTHQGLIQLHHDFCHNFYQGCQQCQIPQMLGKSSEII